MNLITLTVVSENTDLQPPLELCLQSDRERELSLNSVRAVKQYNWLFLWCVLTKKTVRDSSAVLVQWAPLVARAVVSHVPAESVQWATLIAPT